MYHTMGTHGVVGKNPVDRALDIARMCWLIEKLGGTPPLGEIEAKGPKSQVVLRCSVGYVIGSMAYFTYL